MDMHTGEQTGCGAATFVAEAAPDLIFLCKDYRDLAPLEEAAWVLSEDLSEAVEYPAPPDVLFYTPGPDFFALPNPTPGPDGRLWYGSEQVIGDLRSSPRMMSLLVGGTTDDEGAYHPKRVPDSKAQAKADTVLAAYDGWMAARAAVEQTIGLTEARAEAKRLGSELRPIRDAIARTRARNLADLIAKARVSLCCMGGTVDEADIDGTGDGLAVAIVRDLVALASQQEG